MSTLKLELYKYKNDKIPLAISIGVFILAILVVAYSYGKVSDSFREVANKIEDNFIPLSVLFIIILYLTDIFEDWIVKKKKVGSISFSNSSFQIHYYAPDVIKTHNYSDARFEINVYETTKKYPDFRFSFKSLKHFSDSLIIDFGVVEEKYYLKLTDDERINIKGNALFLTEMNRAIIKINEI